MIKYDPKTGKYIDTITGKMFSNDSAYSSFTPLDNAPSQSVIDARGGAYNNMMSKQDSSSMFEMPTWQGTKDFLGSETFSNTMGGLGMAANAYQNFSNAEETKKNNKRMFDLEKGQIDKQDALRTGFQKNYLGR